MTSSMKLGEVGNQPRPIYTTERMVRTRRKSGTDRIILVVYTNNKLPRIGQKLARAKAKDLKIAFTL